MSERKVINKYFPPDFDPSKIKRRKIGRETQMTIRLMAPFSMRCNRCGEYVYKGKKFNARKETAMGEEYYGIKIFRFYIKCPSCSSEITFKTDPKNADYTCEHGATRNFENWAESDPNKRAGAIPDAAADDEYDSDGNQREEAKERDAMADLERSQEQSRREMEMMDELADLRQRNARIELSNMNQDPEALLAALHAERETAEETARKQAEQAEDDALVAQYFAKIPAKPSGTNGAPSAVAGSSKGKGKAVDGENGLGGLDGYSDSEAGSDVADGDEGKAEADAEPKDEALTIKRRPVNGADGKGTNEPTVASILAAKGKTLNGLNGGGTGPNGTAVTGAGGAKPVLVKQNREGMQKLLGIKRKVK